MSASLDPPRSHEPEGRRRPATDAALDALHDPGTLDDASGSPAGGAARAIHSLQRTLGNHGVQRVLDAHAGRSHLHLARLATRRAPEARPPRAATSVVQRVISGATVGERVVRTQADAEGAADEVLEIVRIDGQGADRIYYLKNITRPVAREVGIFGNNTKYDISDKDTARAKLAAYPVINLVDHGAPGTGHQGAVFKALENLASLGYHGDIHLTYERSKTKQFAEKFGFANQFKAVGAPAGSPATTWDMYHADWEGTFNGMPIRCHPIGREIFPEQTYENIMQRLGCSREEFWTLYAWPGAHGLDAAAAAPPLNAIDSRKNWLAGSASLANSQKTFYNAVVEAGLAGRQVDRATIGPVRATAGGVSGATPGQQVIRVSADAQGAADEILEVARLEGDAQDRVYVLRNITRPAAAEFGIFGGNPRYQMKKGPMLTMFAAYDAPGHGGDMYTGGFGGTSWLEAVRTMTGERDPVAVILQPFLWGEGIQVRRGDALTADVKQSIVASGAVPSFKWAPPAEPSDADLPAHVAQKYHDKFGANPPVDPARISDILARGKAHAVHLITVYYTASSGEVDYAQVVKVLNKAVRAGVLHDATPVLIALLGDEQKNAREVALQQNPDVTGVALTGPDPMNVGPVSLAYIGMTPVMQLFERYSELVVTEGANTWQEVLTIGTPALTTRTSETRPFDPAKVSVAHGHDAARALIEGASNAMITVGKKAQVPPNDPDLQPVVDYIHAVRSNNVSLRAFADAWKDALSRPETDQVIQSLKRLPGP